MSSSFSQTPDEVFDQYEEMSDLQLNLMLLNTGLPVDSENFLSMVESWKAGEKECGEFISYGDFEAEMTSSGIVVSTEAEYENKTADIEFTFDEEQKMDSMTINAHYSTSRDSEKGGTEYHPWNGNCIRCFDLYFIHYFSVQIYSGT